MAVFDLIKNNGWRDVDEMFEFQKLVATKKKLNLGSNVDLRDSHINVDIMDFEGLDLRCDIKNLPEYIPPNSIEELLAYDVLEHFPFIETKQLLTDWVSWLAPEGKIIVRVPDLQRLSDALINSKLTVWDVQKLIYGGQDYEYNYHKTGFTSQYLEGLLIGAGCSETIQVIKEDDSFNCTIVARK